MIIAGTIKGKGVKNITGDIYEVKRKWWYFKKYIEVVLKDKKRLTSFLIYRFPFKEPLVDFEELPEISEAEYNKIWSEGEEENKKRKLNKQHPIDWYRYFLSLEQQKKNIALAYKEHEKRKKTVIEVISVHSSSGPIAVKLNM